MTTAGIGFAVVQLAAAFARPACRRPEVLPVNITSWVGLDVKGDRGGRT